MARGEQTGNKIAARHGASASGSHDVFRMKGLLAGSRAPKPMSVFAPTSPRNLDSRRPLNTVI
jgi:hypothetical protein